MPILNVLTFPDERLRIIAKPVEQITQQTQQTIDDMFETMYHKEGIGLAATQVDIHQQIIVIDLSESKEQQLVLINPKIIEKQGEDGIEEGCLSIPETKAVVPRAATIKISYLDRNANEHTLDADGLLAICIQHEIDHLQGKLFIDYLSNLKRQRITTKLQKLKRHNEKQQEE